MGVWDTSTPAGSDAISEGDDRIREMKTAVQEALRGGVAEGLEAVFPGSSPASAPVFHYRGLKGSTAARPASGQYGLYYDTTRLVLQRDNGSSWEDVATIIPAGTKMLFYQAAAPTGWTAVSLNDKFLRVVDAGGTGGSSGGSGLTPSSTITLAHTHTVASHTHDMGDHTHTIAHTHSVPHSDWSGGGGSGAAGRITLSTGGGSPPTGTSFAAGDQTSGSSSAANSGVPSSNTSGAASPATDSQLSNTAFQYADVIVATKD